MGKEIIKTASGNDETQGLQPNPSKELATINPFKRWPTAVVSVLLAAAAGGGVYLLIQIGMALFVENTARATFITGNAVNLFIFLAIVAQACIYLGQRRVMIQQWKAMTDQLEAISKQEAHLVAQSEAAKAQVAAMQFQADIMRQSLEQTQTMAFQSIEALEVTKGQLVAMQHQEQALFRSLEQNERAVKAAEENARIASDAFYVGEAPYFGVVEVVIQGIEEDCSPRVMISFINGGRTPAWHFNALACLAIGETPSSPNHWFISPAVEYMGNTFYPAEAQKTITYTRTDLKFTKEQITALSTGDEFLYLVVTITYKDIRDNLCPSRTFICGYSWKMRRFGDYQIT